MSELEREVRRRSGVRESNSHFPRFRREMRAIALTPFPHLLFCNLSAACKAKALLSLKCDGCDPDESFCGDPQPYRDSVVSDEGTQPPATQAFGDIATACEHNPRSSGSILTDDRVRLQACLAGRGGIRYQSRLSDIWSCRIHAAPAARVLSIAAASLSHHVDSPPRRSGSGCNIGPGSRLGSRCPRVRGLAASRCASAPRTWRGK